MFYLHLNKEIMLSKLKIKRNFFISYFITLFKQSYQSFDVILKIHFKKIKFVIRFSLQKRLFFYVKKE